MAKLTDEQAKKCGCEMPKLKKDQLYKLDIKGKDVQFILDALESYKNHADWRDVEFIKQDILNCTDIYDDSQEEYDAQGIYLCRTCPKCKKEKLSKYRPEILSGYSQADVDEPIEPEDY